MSKWTFPAWRFSGSSIEFPCNAIELLLREVGDVRTLSLQCLAPQAKITVFMQPSEKPHIGKLLEPFPTPAVLTYPVSEQAMQAALDRPT